MPNFEIHGLTRVEVGFQEAVSVIRQTAEELFIRDGVITSSLVLTEVKKAHAPWESAEPFIRVLGTDETQLNRIVAVLKAKGLNMDTEVVLLHDFIEAKEMHP